MTLRCFPPHVQGGSPQLPEAYSRLDALHWRDGGAQRQASTLNDPFYNNFLLLATDMDGLCQLAFPGEYGCRYAVWLGECGWLWVSVWVT